MSKKLNLLIDTESDIIIEYLSEDNRDIKPNTLFFCLKGTSFDAHNVVDEVILKGATVIVHTDKLEHYQEGIVYHLVKDIDLEMAYIASRFYNDVSKDIDLIGVTGTNGKTTVSWLLYDVLNRINSCGYVGTISVSYNNNDYKNLFTTPKPIELNKHLRNMANLNIKNCAIEVSSHALDLKRSNYLDFKYAIMTNLTYEHINYHGSMELYQEAKALLFRGLNADSYAILNKDDITYSDYKAITKAKVISYGVDHKAMYMAQDIQLFEDHTTFTLVVNKTEYPVKTNLVALFNVYNLLAVITCLHLQGHDLELIIKHVEHLNLPQGRMEAINEGQNFNVLVDYAHTPDGFTKVFEYAKELSKGRIISVFGSAGGDRDREKRPVLGEIADQYSDLIILTQEDNREENVIDICNHIKQGIKNTEVIIIDDRLTAVEHALKIAQKDDYILILAKANDKYNVVKDGTAPYEGDIDISKRVLKELSNNS